MQNLMPPIGTPDNLFHDGNPLTGEQGTIVTAAHLNNVQGATRDIQTELLAVLADAKIEVNPEDHAQLLKALKAVIGTVGAGKFLSISKNLKEIADAGGDAKAEAIKNLGLGEAAKRGVGTAANQLPDMSSFTVTGNVNAFVIQLPGGIVIQGGKASTDINGYATVNLGLAMSFFSVLPGESAVSQWVSSGNVYSGLVIYGAQALSPTSFGFRSIWWQGADKTFKGGAATAYWILVGRV